jgi:cell division septation protein DedD
MMSASRPGRCPSFRLAAAAILVVCLGAPYALQAQEKPLSLAEIARKELERRKAVKVPSKVFTDKDVRALSPKIVPPAPAAGTTPPATAEAAAADQKALEKADAQKDEAWWKERVRLVREEIRRNEMFAEALQSRINALAADFANRDDPFQRLRIGDDRQKALAELERVQADMTKLKKQLADIEEEARQAGIPPGWIR